MEIKYVSYSFKGKRISNQDYCVAEKINEYTWFFTLADGMGGTSGGEIASKLAVEIVFGNIKKAFTNQKQAVKDLKSLLSGAYADAQIGIRNEIEKQPHLAGMGTTLVSLLIHKGNYVWANLGDCRLYIISSGEIELLTNDHTYIQEYLDRNKNKIDRDLLNGYEHMLTKCIDGSNELPDIFPPKKKSEKLSDNAAFLLCSDGLIIDKINTNTSLLRNYINGTKTLRTAGENLISFAYEKGSSDNITLILVETEGFVRKQLNLKSYVFPPDQIKNRSDGKKITFFPNFLKR